MRCDEKRYTKASPSINDMLKGEMWALKLEAGSRNLHEDPLANRRFPNRVHISGVGCLAYTRRFPSRIVSGGGSRGCFDFGAAQRGIVVGPGCRSCTPRYKSGGRWSDRCLQRTTAELTERCSRPSSRSRGHLESYYDTDQRAVP